MTLNLFLVTSPWRWSQHGPPKRWYLTTILHCATTQNARNESPLFKSRSITN